MFDIGLVEIVLVLIVGFIIIGPDRLPELAQGLGKVMRVLKDLFDEVRGAWDGVSSDIDLKGDADKPVEKDQDSDHDKK